jgi:hypothetical protein
VKGFQYTKIPLNTVRLEGEMAKSEDIYQKLQPNFPAVEAMRNAA